MPIRLKPATPCLVLACFRNSPLDARLRSIGVSRWSSSPVRRRTPMMARRALKGVLAFYVLVTFCLDWFFHPGRQQL